MLAFWRIGLVGLGLLLPAAAFADQVTVLHVFTGKADGAVPVAGPTVTSEGTVYGETEFGGVICKEPQGFGNYGCGTTYRINPDGSFQTVASFNGDFKGGFGVGPVTIIGENFAGKTLYGATQRRGDGTDYGNIFSVSLDGKNFKVLHRFYKPDSGPGGGLQVDPAGQIFGVAYGGASRNGVIFKLLPDGTYTVLHNFAGGSAGGYPISIVLDAAGTIYGTTYISSVGYASHCNDKNRKAACGLMYSYVPATGVYTVLHYFSGGYDGVDPVLAGVDRNGSVFGTATQGGRGTHGTLFVLHKDPTGFTFHVLWYFDDHKDGGAPNPPFVAQDGTLTGTTSYFGNRPGTLYRYQNGTLTTLYKFHDIDGSRQIGTLARDKYGAFYGAAEFGSGSTYCTSANGTVLDFFEERGWGVVWKYTPP